MNKWCFVPIAFLSLILPTEVKDTSYTIDTTIEGMKYGFYEDEECKNPILDDNEQPYVLEMKDKAQDLSFNEETVFIKQLETVDGYYLDGEVYLLKQHTTLPTYPITLKYESDLYPTAFLLKDEQGKLIREWNAEQEKVPDIIYVAGKSYTLEEQKQIPYTTSKSISISIPYEYDPNFNSKISFQHEVYGSISLHVLDEDEKPIEHVKYALYQDDQAKERIKDCIQESNADGNIQFDVKEGIYYLQQYDISDVFYRNKEVLKIEVKNQETNTLTLHENHVSVTFSMKDLETKDDISASIWLNECNQSVSSNEKIFLKRNTEYSFKDLEHPNGYYACDTSTFHTSEEKENQKIEVLYQPFTVTFKVNDIDTNQSVLSNTYAIYDSDQTEVLSFTMNDSSYQTTSLHDGITYTLKEVGTTNGYVKMDDISFDISNHQKEIQIQGYKIPYTFVQSKIVDEQGNIIDGMIGIYSDINCTKRVKDIYGNVLNQLQGSSIRNGIYYLKLEQLDSHYLWNDEVKKVTIDHQHDFFSYQVKGISMHLQVKTVHGDQLQNVEMQLLDQEGNVIDSFLNQNLNEQILHKLERDHQYSIRISHINGLYTYEKKEKVFSSNDETTFVFECDPYIDFKVKGQGVFALYDDARCTQLSKDMYGIETKKSGSSIEWLMRTGTYYLKQLEVMEGCYENQTIQKVQLKDGEWSIVQEVVNIPIVLDIQIVDEEGQAIEGAEYELLDASGNVLDTISQSNPTYQANWLKPSLQVTLHETKTPDGYQSNPTDIVYTLPDSIPSMNPTILLKYSKEVPSSFIHQDKTTVNETEINNSFPWIIYCGIFVSGLLIAFLVYHFHH